MLSVETSPTRQTTTIPPRGKNSKNNGGPAAREKRLLMGLSLDLVAQRSKAVDLFRLSRWERGLFAITAEQRAAVEAVLREEMERRTAKMAALMAAD